MRSISLLKEGRTFKIMIYYLIFNLIYNFLLMVYFLQESLSYMKIQKYLYGWNLLKVGFLEFYNTVSCLLKLNRNASSYIGIYIINILIHQILK